MANNSTLETNFNVSPWYDDFNEEKNFHRVLFNPSRAVQARELTQMQTILQNQIDRFGEHIFKEGSLVLGGKTNVDLEYHYIKISDTDSLTNDVVVADLFETTLTGGSTGVTASVIGYETGTEADDPDTKTLYITYTNSGTDTVTKTFNPGETITSSGGVLFDILSANTSVGSGSKFSIEEGVIFSKDHFIRFDAQTILLDKYDVSPSYKVGFTIDEDIITYADDTSLLDPASGSTNFQAPGADRLKLTATLTKLDLNAVTSAPKFVELLTIKSGIIQTQVTKTEYSLIKDEMARRTNDESGSYVVRGLNTRVRENLDTGDNGGLLTLGNGGNSSVLSIGVEAGVAYVEGYDIEFLNTVYVDIDKGLDYKVAEQQNVTANYGNYVIVDEFCGTWNVNGNPSVDLYDTAQTKLTSKEFSTTSATGSVIGTAKLKAVLHETGSQGEASTTYRIYLYDIVMTGGDFTSVKSIYYNSAGSDGFADIVLTGGLAYLEETNFNTSIYPVPLNHIRKLRDANDLVDTTFVFSKKYDATASLSGTFSVSTGTANEIFASGNGTLNSTQKNEILVTLNANAAVTGAGTVSVTSGAAAVTGSGTAFTTMFNVGDKIIFDSTGEVYYILSITNNTAMTLTENATSTASGSTYKKQYYSGDALDFTESGSTGTDRTIVVSSSTTAAFDMKESLDSSVSVSVIAPFSKIDAQEIKKTLRRNRLVVINPNTNTAGLTGPWDLGFSDVFQINSVRLSTSAFTTVSDGTDVTSSFILDNGQKDNFYQHGKLVNIGTAAGGSDYYLVDLDYFEHDNSQGVGYFSVDSYPIDDTGVDATKIKTYEIPIYVSPVTGTQYNLRDCVDTRPAKTNTSADVTVLTGISTNPVASTAFNTSIGVLYTPRPNEAFLVDLSYYMRRKDAIYIDRKGNLGTKRGVPALIPMTPQIPEGSMGLSVIDVAPFPSLPSDRARELNRPEYTNKVTRVSHRRYTMRDIGTLDQRLGNLEYYTALSLLEKNTMEMKILDADGLDRFKNGIFVDPFRDHSYADLTDAGYKIAVDKKRGEIRPFFDLNQVGLKVASKSGVVENGNLLTLPYTHEMVASQPFATSTRNAAGLLFNYVGDMFLTPDNDTWVDTTVIPDLVIQDRASQAELANWQQLANAWGTDWNNWQDVWSSTSSSVSTDWLFFETTTTTNQTAQTRTGTQLNVSSTTQTQDLGERVVNVDIVPFMRSRLINVQCVGLKPDTKMYAFFDGENVTDNVRQTNSSFANTNNYGDGLVVDSSGVVYFQFLIPNSTTKRFRTGTKKLRITDSITNSSVIGAVTSSAEGSYTASGINQTKQGTILSVTVPQFSTSTVTENRVLTTQTVNRETDQERSERFAARDPIAQSFMIDSNQLNDNVSGVFLSKIDVYFREKDANLGVIVEVRELNSASYITNKVVPNSRSHIPNASVNTSEDGQTATTITFSSPIFIQTNVEYAIVIKPEANNPNTTVWTARLGEDDIFNGFRVNTQPAVGALYVSSNDRVWQPVQEEDLKFNLYVANFTVGTGTFVLTNNNVEFVNYSSKTGLIPNNDIVKGDNMITLDNVSGGSVANSYILTGGTTGAVGQVVNIDGSTYRVRNTSYTDFGVDEGLTFTYANTSATGITANVASITTPTGKVVYQDDEYVFLDDVTDVFASGEILRCETNNTEITISSVVDLDLSVYDPEIGFIAPPFTSTSWASKTTDSLNALSSSFSEININDNNETKELCKIRTYSNEGGTKSFQIQGSLTTISKYLSPFVDTTRIYTVIVDNIINNDSTDETEPRHGNAYTRYISQKVTLAEGQDAEDLQLFLDGYLPPAADIKVYFKALHSEDSDVFTDLDWVEMTAVNKIVYSDKENKEDFKEFEYSIPSAYLTGAADEFQYVNSNAVTFTGFKYFSIKIVLLSSDKASVPRCRALKVVAMQK